MIFKKGPKDVIFELTNRCNLKCEMCGIWKEKPKEDFDFELFRNILKRRSMRDVVHITFSGGEPFLVKDLKKYYDSVREVLPKAFINISSNGYSTGRIINFFDKGDVKKTSITISYDGIRSHDIIRGKPGSAKNLLNTAKKIKKRFPDIALTLKFTTIEKNKKEILDTAKQVASMNIPFRIKVEEDLNCHHSRIIKSGKRDLRISEEIFRQAKKILELNIKTNRNFIKQLIKKEHKKILTCNWSRRTIFIGLDGQVFLCRKKEAVGNLKNQNIDEILRSKQFNSISRQMKSCKDYSCISYRND